LAIPSAGTAALLAVSEQQRSFGSCASATVAAVRSAHARPTRVHLVEHRLPPPHDIQMLARHLVLLGGIGFASREKLSLGG
jgi:hypothetical protein